MGLRLFRERCKESVLQSGRGRPCTGGVRHPLRGLWGGAASSTKASKSEPGASPNVSEAFSQAKPSMRIRSKKGFFFTMVAIALSMVLILSFRVYDVQERNQKDEVVTARILALNHLVKDVKEDVRKGLYITSKRALLGIQEYVAEEGAFLPNATASFREGLLNGTIQGIETNLTVNATFPDWMAKIQEQAAKADVDLNITILSISLQHAGPWDANVTAVMDINVTDRKGTASWQQEQEVSALVSIIDLEDPLYVVKTGGKITNIIRHTNYTPFVQGSDVTNLLLHTNDSLYIASNYSPSYVMRLEGNLSASPDGIESLVNVVKLQINNVQTYDRSVADAVYFGTETTTNYRINNTPSWFKLDESRLDLYGVAGLTT